MLSGNHDSVEAIRWIPYRCPECNHRFSLSSASKLDSTTCPSCERYIPLIEEIAQYAKPEILANKGIRRRRVTKKHKALSNHTWEEEPTSKDAKASKRSSIVGSIVLFVLSFFTVMGALVFYVKKIQDSDAISAAPTGNSIGSDKSKVSKPPLSRYSAVEFLRIVEPLAEKLLNATRMEDLFPLIAYPEKHKEKMAAYYPDGILKPRGLIPFGSDTELLFKDANAGVIVQTSDYKPLSLVFVETEEGIKIDWESWVAWSEMPWKTIIEEKPTKPILVRAKYRAANYYNFDFSDEKKWSCYEIASPDESHFIYGYVERGSDLDIMLKPIHEKVFVGVTLKISFAEGSQNGKQVLIHDRVADGWILSEE
jgi:hypothetical protein